MKLNIRNIYIYVLIGILALALHIAVHQQHKRLGCFADFDERSFVNRQGFERIEHADNNKLNIRISVINALYYCIKVYLEFFVCIVECFYSNRHNFIELTDAFGKLHKLHKCSSQVSGLLEMLFYCIKRLVGIRFRIEHLKYIEHCIAKQIIGADVHSQYVRILNAFYVIGLLCGEIGFMNKASTVIRIMPVCYLIAGVYHMAYLMAAESAPAKLTQFGVKRICKQSVICVRLRCAQRRHSIICGAIARRNTIAKACVYLIRLIFLLCIGQCRRAECENHYKNEREA